MRGGALLDRRREYRLQGQVINHVDRRDTVTLAECPADDLFQRHGTTGTGKTSARG